MTGFQVDPDALAVTAEGVQGVVDEMGQLGINGEQESGGPVTNLALSNDDAGNDLVSVLLGQMLERAHYVFRDLTTNAEQMVTRLQTNRTHYQQVEHEISTKFTALGDQFGRAMLGSPSTGSAW